MENALDKLDDLEYELEKAYECLDDHKGDKRKSCSSRKKVCMLQKACERSRDAYEDEFEEESSDEDDDGWVCMDSLVHQVGIPKMEEKETKKETGQKSLEEPLDNLILSLECAYGVEEEYPLLKITPILSNERMEIGIWREDLKIQESQKDEGSNAVDLCTSMATLSTSTIVGFGTYVIVNSMRVDAGNDGIVNAMEVDASLNALIDGFLVNFWLETAELVSFIVQDRYWSLVSFRIGLVTAGSGLWLVSGQDWLLVSADASIDAAKDIEVVGMNAIFGDRKDMGEEDLTNRGARMGEAIHDGVNIDGVNVIVNAFEVAASTNIVVDGAIFGDRRDIGEEALTNRKAVIVEAVLKIDVVAHKEICQVDVASLAVDLQAVHDGVLRDVECDTLENTTLSMFTTICYGTNAIIDPMAVDAEIDGNVNAMKVDSSTNASTNATIDGDLIVETDEVVGIDANVGNTRELREVTVCRCDERHACSVTLVMWQPIVGLHETVRMYGIIGGHRVTVFIDDGANRNFLNYSLVKKLKLVETESDHEYTVGLANGYDKTIFHKDELIAEVKRKYTAGNMLLDKHTFNVVVCPQFVDQAFVALVIIMDVIQED
ncbi:hypothetical protein L7F22_020787 [Adiantum nelumboides]|nr:hypothetical protein [Adiantum nelumboides]